MKELKGQIHAQGKTFGIVVARFNELITKNLLAGAIDAFLQHGASIDDLTITWVPGSFELPLVAKTMAASEQFDAIIALGVVIRGATPHFDYVCAQTAAGIAQASLSTNIPIIFGVLTTDNAEQAFERSGIKGGNKGYDAACNAMEMASLMSHLASFRGHLL